MPRNPKINLARLGFSYLELQVAFVLLGIALAGLGPMVVVQSKQLRRLESRFRDGTKYYLVPSDNPWARKLGAAASLSTDEPSAPDPAVTQIDNEDSGYYEIDPGSVDWTTASGGNAFGGTLRWMGCSERPATSRWQIPCACATSSGS